MGDLAAAPEPDPGDEPEPQAARAAAGSTAPVREMMVRLRSMVLNLLEALRITGKERVHDGRGPEVGGAAVEDEPSPGQDEDPLADLRDQVQAVLHEQHARQPGQLAQQPAAPPPVRIG